MGIPKFNKWLSKKVRITKTKGVYFDRLPNRISSLSFDLNGIIHRARQIVYGLTEETLPEYKKTLEEMKPKEIQRKVFNTVCLILADVTLKVSPSDTVLIAVDGITNMAKIKQQRGRRYNSAANEYKGQPDSCEVTPGTLFMLKLDMYMKKWLANNRHYFPANLIYSSHLDPGEGEHKIMSFFRRGKIAGEGFHSIYGLDGDLVLLSMMSPQNNILLIREDLDKLISINGLKRMLVDMAPLKLKDHVIPDFVAMMSLIGNDFIPHGHLHDSMYERIEAILDEYLKQGLPITEKTQTVRVINFNNLAFVTNHLGNIDIKRTSVEAVNQFTEPKKYHPSRFYGVSIIQQDVVGRPGVKRNVFDYSRFRSAWYNNELLVSGGVPGIKDDILATEVGIEDMSKRYIEGMAWVFRYYQTIHVESYWYYSYNHPPLMKDLAAVMKSLPPGFGHDLNDRFKVQFNLIHKPIDQLLMVIPTSNMKNNVPPAFHKVMGPSSGYTYLFPCGFRLELDGLGIDETYLATPIINMPDYKKVLHITRGFDFDFWKQQDPEFYRATKESLDNYVLLSTEARNEYNKDVAKYDKIKEDRRLQNKIVDKAKGKKKTEKVQTKPEKRVESYDINSADIRKIGDFVLVQDSTLKYGTKMRLLPYFKNLKATGFTEAVAASSSYGYGQAAAAWCCKEAGLKCTLFIAKEKRQTKMTQEAIKLGAKVNEIPGAKMAVLAKMADEYEKGNPKVAHLPIGLYSPDAMKTLVDNMRNIKNRYNLNPRRIWVVGGTGFIASSIAKAFPNAEMHVVQVGFDLWKDVMEGVKYKLYKYPGSYKEATTEPPPYEALSTYDAKVWYFAKRFGKPGDMIWNVK